MFQIGTDGRWQFIKGDITSLRLKTIVIKLLYI